MKFDVELVGKIGSMALIDKQDNMIDYTRVARLSRELKPGYIWISSGATEIGRLDYMMRAGRELPDSEDAKTDYAAQGQAILMQTYRQYVDSKYSVRQILVEHHHFNDPVKREILKKPGGGALAVSASVFAVFLALSVAAVTGVYGGPAAYLAYALSALTLGYTVYALICVLPRAKAALLDRAGRQGAARGRLRKAYLKIRYAPSIARAGRGVNRASADMPAVDTAFAAGQRQPVDDLADLAVPEIPLVPAGGLPPGHGKAVGAQFVAQLHVQPQQVIGVAARQVDAGLFVGQAAQLVCQRRQVGVAAGDARARAEQPFQVGGAVVEVGRAVGKAVHARDDVGCGQRRDRPKGIVVL